MKTKIFLSVKLHPESIRFIFYGRADINPRKLEKIKKKYTPRYIHICVEKEGIKYIVCSNLELK